MTVSIHQTLHGYAEGHRLLATSRKLTSSSQRVLRTLTDLSGPRLIPGFEDYLSGYSLPDDRLFVFSRTWYANEAERPGCVWTHSLLLGEESLRDVPSLSSLLQYFRRPESDGDFSNYERQLTLSQIESFIFPNNSPSIAPKIITALYTNDAPVVLPDKNSVNFAPLHLELWQNYFELTGQWLQFCTGALKLRQAVRGPFDLQTVPIQSLRDISRSTTKFQVVTETDGAVADWAVALAYHPSDQFIHEFRQFLERYSSFPIDGRSSIGPYSVLWQTLNKSRNDLTDLESTVRQFQEYFPEKSRAARLKVAVASSPDYRHFYRGLTDIGVMSALISDDSRNAFDAATLDIPNRLMTAWKATPQVTTDLIRAARNSRNDISQAIISTFSESLRPTDVAELLQWASDLFPDLITANPSLLISPAIWRASRNVREIALHTLLNRTDVTDDVLFPIIECQLDSGVSDLAEAMTTRFGVRVADAALSWGKLNKWQFVPEDWQCAFEKLEDKFSSWLESTLERDRAGILALPRVIAIQSHMARSLPSTSWVKAVERTDRDNVEIEQSSISLYVLKMGLERPDPDGESLVSAAFPRVYVAASHNAVDDRLWKATEESFKTWWRWDRCRTLRTGLVNKFAWNGWSPESFVRALPYSSVLFDILSAWGWDKNEKRFLGAVIHHLLAFPVQPDPSFRNVAAQCAHWFDVRLSDGNL